MKIITVQPRQAVKTIGGLRICLKYGVDAGAIRRRVPSAVQFAFRSILTTPLIVIQPSLTSLIRLRTSSSKWEPSQSTVPYVLALSPAIG